METVADTLIERVDKLVQASQTPREWGGPHPSATPTSLAIQELAKEIEALQSAVREIALEVQRLAARP